MGKNKLRPALAAFLLMLTMSLLSTALSFLSHRSACVKKHCRGEHRSSADFAKAKSVTVRRKDGCFPSENPKIKDFRRTSNARPYIFIGKSVR